MTGFAPVAVIREAKARVESLPVPSIIFIVYCFFLIDYFGRLSARIPAYGSLRPSIILVAVISLLLLTQIPKIRHALTEKPIQIILLLIFYIFISLPLVEWPGSVVKNNLDDFIKAVVFLFFTAIIIDTDRRLKIFVTLFIGLQLIRILEPLTTYFLTGELRDRTFIGGGEFAMRLGGAAADVVNSNGLGFVIVTTLAFMHFLMGGSHHRALRWLYYALAPLLLYALILTASRGAFIVLLVLAVFVFLDSRRKVLLATIAVIGTLVMLATMSDFHKDRYRSIVMHDESALGQTSASRIDLIVTEFRLGLMRPVFGHGLGTTWEAKVHKMGLRPQASHNLYAEIMIELGFIGAAIFISYLVVLYILVRSNLLAFQKAVREEADISGFQLRLNKALLAVFWVYAVYSINYYGLSQEYWYLFGGLCIAFAASIARARESNVASAAGDGQQQSSPAVRSFVPREGQAWVR